MPVDSTICPHPHVQVVLIITKCSECGKQFQHHVATANQRAQTLLVQIHQGLIDAETVIAAGGYTEEEQAQLRAAWEGHCEHEQVEEYECSCSQKTRWRCKSCARVWDHKPRKRM
jgi:transposase-like protein